MKYIASVSFGKDSLAMLLMLIEKQYPLDEVVFYDTSMEFQAIYNLRDMVKPMLERHGIRYVELHPKESFEHKMFHHIRKRGKRQGEAGYQWCGGRCRWGTTDKLAAIDAYCKKNNAIDYVGLAADETERLKKERKPHKIFPLAEWGMTEADCLAYCRNKGYNWVEDGIDLYTILKRVSCWCCRNKNLAELKNMYMHFRGSYWARLKEMQSKLTLPMKPPYTVHDLEERFDKEIEAGLTWQRINRKRSKS